MSGGIEEMNKKLISGIIKEEKNNIYLKSSELAEKHWSYIKSLLETHGEETNDINKIEFHYKSALIHGFGHGYEYAKRGEL